MATFQSLQMSTPKYPVSGPGIGGRSLKVERAEVSLASLNGGAALAIGDVIQLFKLHPKFRIVSGHVQIKAALGAGVTGIIGDAGDDDRYFVSQSYNTAGTTTTIAETGRDFLSAATAPGGAGRYTTVNLTIQGAVPNTTGSVVVILTGYIEEPA